MTRPLQRGTIPIFLAVFALALAAPPLRAGDGGAIRRLIGEAGDASRYGGADRVVIFDRTEADVQESGLTYVDREELIKVLARRGGTALRAVTYSYDPQSAKVEVLAARIYRKSGAVEEIPLESVVDCPAPARMIYWGMREVMVPVGRLEPGDALYVKTFKKGFTYALLDGTGAGAALPGGSAAVTPASGAVFPAGGPSAAAVPAATFPAGGASAAAVPAAPQGERAERTGHRDRSDEKRYAPPMRGHFYDIVRFWSSAPVLEKSYTALVPADKVLQYEIYNGEATCSVHRRGDKIAYRFTKRDIEPFRNEPDGMASSDVACKLLLSTAPDWKAKSLWFHGVNEDYGSFDVTPEVKAEVDELTANCTTDDEKIHVLTHWVADNIRYSGISMGEGEGYTLHKGAMTFHDRCGVCKDKAGMLITMLRAAGFESYPAMTMAGSRIDRIPADQFNHCVTLVKRGEGNYQLLDPTWVPFVRELWSSAEQQQNYLMGVPEGAGLRETPISPPEKHYFRVKGKSRLDAEGGLTGRFTVAAEGQSDARMRRAFVRGRKALWRNFFEKALYAISPRAEFLSLDYTDPYDTSEPMTVSIEYRIPRYAVVAKDRILFTPVVARFPFSDRGTSYFLHMNLDLKERRTGFKTRCSRLVELDETVEIPPGWKVGRTPEAAPVEGPAASFAGGYRAEEGKLLYSARLALKKRVYEASEYENFRSAVRGVKTMMEGDVVLER